MFCKIISFFCSCRRKFLTKPSQNQIGFLSGHILLAVLPHLQYRLKVYWWEVTIVFRKITLVVVGGIFGARLGPDMQVYMALALVFLFIVLHLGIRPYDELTKMHGVLHWLELGALMVCWGTLYCGMLFWIGERLPSLFRIIVSIFIVVGNIAFTVFSALVYIRATRMEADKESGQSEKALKQRLRFRSRAKGYGPKIYSRTFGAKQRRFKDHVDGALHVKLAKTTVDAHDMSLNAHQAKMKEHRALSSDRLKRRLELRKKSNASGETTGQKMTGIKLKVITATG